ncbi:MAG: carotenoid oxygenase family protein [Burkholderiales bacterium]|nr:carotenoid oxygenase family protein [Burkholderiales bacterium]
MTKPLPQNKLLEGIFKPWSAESTINDLIVIGEIPRELNGTFFRNGPNPQYVFSDKYHFFGGDGMIHALNFKDGQVSYKNRWVRTNKFNLEREARRSLFAGFREFGKSDPSVQNMRAETANTNIINHGGKLLALQEASLPYEINIDTLETIGVTSYFEALRNSMTAHPKIDPVTGELISYSYINPIETEYIYYYVADKNRNITKCERINIPYLSLLHDFAITKDYVIFPLFPLVMSYQRMFNGEDLYKWEPERGSYFGIIPRNGNNNDVIWIHVPEANCLSIHTVAAYQEGDLIILDTMLADNIPAGANGFTADADSFPNYLTRWIFDLKSQSLLSKTVLDDMAGEFPRIDDRFMGIKYRHVYIAATLHSDWFGYIFDAIVHYDLISNKKQVHDFGAGNMPAEPIFVPRNSTASEGDGFLLTYVYREKEDRSDLVILDALNVDHDPLAIIQIPHRVPFGFHGLWVPLNL